MQEADRVLTRTPARGGNRESRKFGFVIYQALYAPWVFLKAVYAQLVVLLLMFISGAAIFSYYEGLPPLDAFLASVSTITTIGLYVPNGGDFLTLNRTEAALLVVMILVSVGAGASILQNTVGSVVNGELAKGEVEKKLIRHLKGHVIVFGYGHLGRYVAEKLSEMGFDYVVVTRNPQIYDSLLKRDVLAILEIEGHPVDALQTSGVDKAALVVAAHADDPDNLVLVLTARRLRPDIRIVSVVNDPNLVETTKIAGANVVVPASVTIGHLLALSAVTKDLVGVVFSEEIGTKEIAQFTIFKRSKLVGKSMAEVAKLAMVIGVVRKEAVVSNIFDPGFRLVEDDILLVLGDPSSLRTLEEEAEAT